MKQKSTLLSLFSLFCLLNLASAQTEYEWDAYGIGFSVTDDFMVSTNSEDAFRAVSSDGKIDIAIYPWLDETVSEDDLEDALIDYADDILDSVDDIDADALTIQDFVGYYLVAAADEEMLLMAFMLDKLSDTNAVVQITFEQGNEEEAIDILSSFYSYDE